jgi:hypothetical protein
MPAPIDYDKMAAASIRVAKESLNAEEEAIKRLYPEYIRMQFGTAEQLAGKLDNQYLGRVRDTLDSEIRATQAPNAIEAELQRQAESELALGRRLSPEEERQAQQAARAGAASRGMAMGQSTLAAEILNRDAFANQRLNERRAFANQANQIDLARRQRLVGLSGAYGELDPYRAAIGPAFGLGSSTLSNTTGQVRDIYGGSLQQAGNVESFNRNMQASDRFSVRNYNAAVQGAAMQAGAAGNAGTMGMIGSIAGSALIGAAMLSDRREKTDIKKIGQTADVLGLPAYQYKYKGDDQTRVGFMAQDVKKVLPEAVEETTIKGKTRLAIKPAVIGQALAKQLTA